MSYVRLIYVLYLLGDGLHLFWFSRKTVHAHISGRQNKNKLKKEHVEISEQTLLSSHQFIHQFFVCEFWEKCARQLRSIWMFKSEVNHFFTILSYTISETMSWGKNKMGHCYEERKMAGWENK